MTSNVSRTPLGEMHVGSRRAWVVEADETQAYQCRAAEGQSAWKGG